MNHFDPESLFGAILRLEARAIFQDAQIHTLKASFLQFSEACNVTHDKDGRPLFEALHEAAVSHARNQLAAIADENAGLASALRKILDEHTGS